MANAINSLNYGNNIYTFTLPYGVCDTAAGTATKVVTVDNFSLETGAVVIVKFANANTASSPKLNVNGTGAKAIMRYGTTAASTSSGSSGWYAGAVSIFVYDGTNWIRDYWYNSTYSNAALGQGYATCSTAEATVAKTATLSSYSISTGGIVAVKFTYAVPASATLNVNSKGAKNIFYRGAAITAGVIKAGDLATFIYDGTQYQLISIDRWQEDLKNVYTKSEVDAAITNSDKVFIATYGTTTYADIIAAKNAGKLCICSNGDNYMTESTILSYYDVDKAVFSSLQLDGTMSFYIVTKNNAWSFEGGSYFVHLNGDSTINGHLRLNEEPVDWNDAANKEYVDNKVANSSEVFIATFDVTTYEEIKAAYDAGKVCFAVKGSVLYPLSAMSGILCMFSNVRIGMIKQISISKTNVWTENDDVHVLNKSGDVMTGSLTVMDNFNVNKTFDSTEYKTYVRPINYSIGNNGDYATGLIRYKGDTNQAQLMFNKDGVMLRDNVNSKAYQLFGQHNTDALKTVIESVGAAKVAIGTYTGTGTYGSSNKNSLTLGFAPKYMRIICANAEEKMDAFKSSSMAFIEDTDSKLSTLTPTWSDNGVSWYTTSTSSSAAKYQMNSSGTVYYYVAIG